MKNIHWLLLFNCFLYPLNAFIIDCLGFSFLQNRSWVTENPSGESFVFVHKNKASNKFLLKTTYPGKHLAASTAPKNLIFTGYKIKPGKYLTIHSLQNLQKPLGFVQITDHFKKTYDLGNGQKLEVTVQAKITPLTSKIFEGISKSTTNHSQEIENINSALDEPFMLLNDSNEIKKSNSSKKAPDDFLRPLLKKNLKIFVQSFIVSFSFT